ncbi:hypothetical protein EYZ11_010171 [Aspergillus tanneri]|uniref:Uncharacterized protein n=1 Tax=Aspergillus tanneri TaxID=1220188 RepID=A0A4S3J620_9EURO|nr:hypothetical protein EYZ11_010171 [Aspergillus tanneri]
MVQQGETLQYIFNLLSPIELENGSFVSEKIWVPEPFTPEKVQEQIEKLKKDWDTEKISKQLVDLDLQKLDLPEASPLAILLHSSNKHTLQEKQHLAKQMCTNWHTEAKLARANLRNEKDCKDFLEKASRKGVELIMTKDRIIGELIKHPEDGPLEQVSTTQESSPRKPRKCGICGMNGHNQRTCSSANL